MNERIHEVIVITHNPDGSPNIAPMGLRQRDGLWLIAPFRPSRTLDNLLREGAASINTTDDIRVYAGCLSGHYDWPLQPCEQIGGFYLANALSHWEVELARIEDDEYRPELFCRFVHGVTHRPFAGFNRAQAAVLELAILVSRLDMLPRDKIDTEIDYLQIAIDKTAGEEELTAWSWLIQRVEDHRERACA
jgi:hypothetical protein